MAILKDTVQKNGRKKSFILLIIGIVLFATSLTLALYTHGHSLKESQKTGEELNKVKKTIEQVQAGTLEGNLDELNAEKEALSDK